MCVCVCVYFSFSGISLFLPFLYTVFCAFSPAYVHTICHGAIAMCGVWFASILCLVWFFKEWGSHRHIFCWYFAIFCSAEYVFVNPVCWSDVALFVCASAYMTQFIIRNDTTLGFQLTLHWDNWCVSCWYLSTSSAPQHAYLHSKHISMHGLWFNIVLHCFHACPHHKFRKHLFLRHAQHTYTQGQHWFSVSVTVSASINVSLSSQATLSNLSLLLQPLFFLWNQVFLFQSMRYFFPLFLTRETFPLLPWE